MRKALTAAMAALTFGGAVAASAVPAQARPHGGHSYGGDYRYHDRNDAGAAIAAGVLGLALGAALTSGSHTSYGPYGYAGGYYAPPYRGGYYEPGYRVCQSRRWVYDPYIGRNVRVTSRYAC